MPCSQKTIILKVLIFPNYSCNAQLKVQKGGGCFFSFVVTDNSKIYMKKQRDINSQKKIKQDGYGRLALPYLNYLQVTLSQYKAKHSIKYRIERQTHTNTWFTAKGLLHSYRKRMVFSINGAWTIRYTHAKQNPKHKTIYSILNK